MDQLRPRLEKINPRFGLKFADLLQKQANYPLTPASDRAEV